jgi:hypothetical protein
MAKKQREAEQPPPGSRWGHSPAHAEALELRKSEWTPPPELSLSALEHQPRLPLMSILNFLAFGAPSPPADTPPFMCVARRGRAFKALCSAARDDKVTLFGTPQSGGSRQRIDPTEFDPGLSLTGEDGAIGHDLESAPMERYVELHPKSLAVA